MKTCMRYLAVIFAVAMIICSLSSVSAAFPDVASDNKYIAAIETMTNLGILGGYEDGTFRPDDLVRRDEMAKIVFVTYTTYTDAGEGTLTFPDVAKNSWAKGYISWCAGKKIVGGYEDGTFKPEGNITYDEALKMVCAMLGYTDFSSDLWPIDVRTKGLIDLELGKNLDGVAGDAALTRAQIVQLVFNSLDKPLYQAPKTEEEQNHIDKIFSGMGIEIVVDKTTLKDNVWNIDTIEAQVIATENYGLRDYAAGIVGTKTGKEDEIVARFNYADGTFEDKELKLSEIALDAYVGNSDALIALNINIIKDKNAKDEYISAELKGIRNNALTGGYASTDGVETFKSGVNIFAQYGVKIEGVNYYNERFWDLKRITYFDDFVLVTPAHIKTGEYQVTKKFQLDYASNYKYNRWKSDVTFGFTQGFHKVQNGIDKDNDGWYDYVLIEWPELFKVKKVTSKTVELEYLHKNKLDWKAVPEIDLKLFTDVDGSALYSGYESTTNDGVIPGLDFVFPIENVTFMSPLKEGAVIMGYQMGDTFTVTADAVAYTGYITKYDASNKKYTLDSGKTLGGDYCYYKVWNSHFMSESMFSTFNTSMKPLIGINSDGEYNIAKFWTIEDKIIYAEKTDSVAAAGTATHNKAILLYVTEATEPQVNEESKEYETFYPAYLVIDGRTHLVNLNPTYAIDKFSGETVCADGSKYRASVINDEGVQRIIYTNMLVTYTIDGNGYYTLHTTADDIANSKDPDHPIEKVIAANENNKISVDEETGLFTITTVDEKGNPVEYRKIMKNADSIIYYPDFKASTGKHEYVEYYKGDEIPTDFADVAVRSAIYLTYNEDKGVYYIAALMIDEEFTGEVTAENDYTTDARQHLYAVKDIEAVAEGSDIFAAYTFKNIVTLETVEATNKLVEYNKATEVAKYGIYAWDASEKNYVEVTSADCESFKDAEVITDIIVEDGVIFTTSFEKGYKIDDTVSIIALADKEEVELKEITFDELNDVFETIEKYNEDFSASELLNAKIGTYIDENKKTKIAYILIDWVEYDEELEALVIAGETKE